MKKLYMLAVLLPDSLEDLILQFKQEIANRYRSVAALRPMGHIVLQDRFLCDDNALPRLEYRIGQACASAKPFTVQLENFGAFAPHTIFAAIRDFFPFQRLRDLISAQLRHELSLPEGAWAVRAITPHITIAHRDLTPEAFELAWTDFSSRELSAEFSVTSAHLLELRGKWRSVREFSLNGDEVNSSQELRPELFCA